MVVCDTGEHSALEGTEMGPDDFRRMALALDGVFESAQTAGLPARDRKIEA